MDRYVAFAPVEHEKLINQLNTLKAWKPLPARRVCVPKVNGNGKKRPLGIPSLIKVANKLW